MRFIKLFEDFKSKDFQSVEELENYLRKFSIPISSWGTGKAKDLQDLYEELVNNECQLIENGESLHRIIEFVGVEVPELTPVNHNEQLEDVMLEIMDSELVVNS
jgi:hypothetical protein